MGNKNSSTITSNEENETSEWKKLKFVPLSDPSYSQPILLNDSNILLAFKYIGHSDDQRYLVLYDSKTDKYNVKWIKITKLCKLYQNICFSNNNKTKVYIVGGLYHCFLEIDVKKKKIIEHIKNDLQCFDKSAEYNYQHLGECAMVAAQNNIIHIVGGSKSSKHLQLDTLSEHPKFRILCPSLFAGDKDATYSEGGIVWNALSGNMIAFGGKSNKHFLKEIWIGKETDSSWNWRRSRGRNLPQKIHLFGYILIGYFVVIFGGKTHDGNPSNAIFYCKLRENDDLISFRKLNSLTCPDPISGQCFSVLDDTSDKIHLFHRKYHYTIPCQLLRKTIDEEYDEKTDSVMEEKTDSVNHDPEIKQEHADSIVTNPLVILLGIKTYNESTKLKDLSGTKLDIEAYKSCFENEYNYKVICEDKYKWVGDEIDHFLINARKHLVDIENDTKGSQSSHDGLIVVIAGHGNKDVFIQSDGVERGIDYYHAFFSSVWSDVISSLKIRLFIIDCCRGVYKSGQTRYHKRNDPHNINASRGNDQHIDDLLVSIYGNSPGHEVKEDEWGGLFSQSLIDALKEKDAKMPLARLLKRVKQDLNEESNHAQLVNTEGDPCALLCVLAPNT